MTTTDFLSLPAREQQDALVAEKVMGWEKVESGGLVWWEKGIQRAHVDSPQNPIAHYTTDISAAWEVIEKLKGEDFCCIDVRFREFEGFECELTQGGYGEHHGPKYLGNVAPTAPLAICLAALKAKGVLTD